jgi:hypothetical protein
MQVAAKVGFEPKLPDAATHTNGGKGRRAGIRCRCEPVVPRRWKQTLRQRQLFPFEALLEANHMTLPYDDPRLSVQSRSEPLRRHMAIK